MSTKDTKILFEGWRKFLSEVSQDQLETEAEEPSHELRKTASKKTHLAIFDFDGVLFTPAPSPVKAMSYYWSNTVGSLSGTPIDQGVSKAKELNTDHTIVILTARTLVDKERADKNGKKYGDIFNEFMSQQSTTELTDEAFAEKVAEILGFMPEKIVRTNKQFNSAMYKKDEFPLIVREFVKPTGKRHNVKFFDNDSKTLNAVAGVPLQMGDKVVIDYEFYLTTESFETPTIKKSTSAERKGETTPEEEAE